MNHYFYLGSGLLLCPLFSCAAQAENSYHPVHQMDTIIITATAQQENIHNVVGSADVVDGQQLRQRYVNDVTEALDDRVGVQQIGIGLDRKGISIRGMDSEHTLYLVDGERINSSAGAIAHSDAEMNWVPIQAVEQIEVVRGPLSSLYGSEALGGVVNVITKKPTQQWEGALSTQALFNSSDLGGDQYKSSIYLAGPLIKNTLGLNFWGEYRHRDMLQDAFNDHLANQDEQKNRKAHLGIFWQPTDQQSIDISIDHGIEQRKDFRGSNTAYYQVDDKIKRTRYSLKHEGDWDWGKSLVKLYQTQLERDSERSDNGEITTPQKLTDTILNTQFQFQTGYHQWTVGNELRQEELEDPTVNKNHQARLNHYGMYLQDQWQLSPQAKLVWGTRGDYHEDFGWELSPKLNGLYQLNQQWTIRAGVGKGFKAPTLKQLSPEYESYSAMGGRGIIRGNPDLKPESNIAYEFGLHFHQGNFESSLTWFQNNVDDLIETQRQASCDVKGKVCLNYINIAEAKIEGLEWSALYRLEPNWHFEANYTYMDARNKTESVPLEDRSRHQFNSSIIWQPTDKLQAKLRQQYRGKQYQGSSVADAPAYTLWHFYTDYQINPNWSIDTGIENLTNKRLGNDENSLYTFTDAGRRYFVGINVRF